MTAESTERALAAAATTAMRGRFAWNQPKGRWFVRQPSGIYYPEDVEEVSAAVSEVVWQLEPWASSRKISAVKSLLKVPLAVKPNKFDADAHKLGVRNGILDLETQQLLRKVPDDLYITMQMGCEFKPKAKCPKWLKHLRTVFDGDDELIEFFHRHMGAALIGDFLIKPQVFIYLQGETGGGKGVTVRTVSDVLGDYAADFDSNDFTEKGERHSQWKQRMKGRRLAFINEVKKSPIDVAMLKAMSGGDKQIAHSMRENDEEWMPTATLCFTSNVRPNFEGDTSGMQRRYLPLRTGPQRKPTPGYEQALQAEASGILNWLLDGYRLWLADGAGEIAVPERVADLRDAHIVDNDPMQVFVNSCLVLLDADDVPKHTYRVDRRELREAYRRHLKRVGDVTTIIEDHDKRWGRLWDILDNQAEPWRASNDRGWWNIYIRPDEDFDHSWHE